MPLIKGLLMVVLSFSLLSGCQKKDDDTADTSSDSNSNAAEQALSEAGSNSSASEGVSPALMDADLIASNAIDMNSVDPQDIFSAKPYAVCSYSQRSACSVGTLVGAAVSDSITRTAGVNGGTTSLAALATALGTFTITTDTQGGTTYSGTTIPSTGVVVTKTASGTRTITGGGVHKVLTGPRGKT